MKKTKKKRNQKKQEKEEQGEPAVRRGSSFTMSPSTHQEKGNIQHKKEARFAPLWNHAGLSSSRKHATKMHHEEKEREIERKRRRGTRWETREASKEPTDRPTNQPARTHSLWSARLSFWLHHGRGRTPYTNVRTNYIEELVTHAQVASDTSLFWMEELPRRRRGERRGSLTRGNSQRKKH